METGLPSCENSEIDICSDRKLSDPEYANGVMLLSKGPGELEVFRGYLNNRVGMFGIRFEV